MENTTNHPGGGAPPSTTAAGTTIANIAASATKVAVEAAAGPRRRATGVKRKANNFNSSSSSKRQSRGRNSTPLPHINHNHNGPVTRARQSPNKLAAAAAAAASGVGASTSFFSASVGSASVMHDKPTESLLQPTPLHSAIGEVITASQGLVSAENDKTMTLQPDVDAEFEAVRSRDPNVHVIPTPAAWFSWTKIHPLEERALPSFFNGKFENRTADIYMEIRNSIMKKFHKDPKTQIEAKDLSELTMGELDARQAVMEFLDHWGLINFHPFPVVGSDTAEGNTGESMKAASLVDKLYRFEVALPCRQEGPRADLSMQATLPRLLPESAIADEARPEGPAVEYHCNSCSADCSRKRYHCQKQADFDLCSDCYNNGKFDSGMSPADFILMEPAEVPGVSGGSWTDQETLLLLEALELFGENWTEIAEHVATKSKAQCILHFVQMPIEDTFLEGKDDFDATVQGNNSSALKECNEPVECNSAGNTDLSTSKEFHETKEGNTTNNGSSTLNKSPETTESKSLAGERPLSPEMDASDRRGTVEVNVVQEISANCVINALHEAFQAVGSGEAISFADAGNPVMALAAFLSGLVSPDAAAAAASARSSLKATSEEFPGIQLASRHCFILEDPPEDTKEHPTSERNCSVDVDMLDGEVQKDDSKTQNVECQIEESLQVQDNASVEAQKDDKKEDNIQVQNDVAVLDGSDVSKESTNKEMEDASPKEMALLAYVPDEGKEISASEGMYDATVKEKLDDLHNKEKPDDPNNKEKLDDLNNKEKADDAHNKEKPDDMNDEKKQDDVDNKEKADDANINKEPDDANNSKEPNDVNNKEEPDDVNNKKGPDDVTNKEDVAPGSMNKVDNSALPDQDQPSSQDVCKVLCVAKGPDDVFNKDAGALSTMKESGDSTLPGKDLPITITASGVLANPSDIASVSVKESSAVSLPGDISRFPEAPKDVDMDSASVPSEGKDPQETVVPSSAVETGSSAECKSEKTCSLEKIRVDHDVDKVRRAALAAISAAAVKSKLLADQEEDQIRQLATFLIEKQLHKIETKLAFFADIENVVIKAKDQMDRSRQRLYHERAQIIAARLGMPAPSSRAMPPSLPNQRGAMSYANSMPKSLPNMNSQKTSANTITNVSAPAPSFSSVSTAAPGGSTRNSR